MPGREFLGRLSTQKSWRPGVSRVIYPGLALWMSSASLETRVLLPAGKAGQWLGSATETYYEELPTILPVLCARLHELRRLEHAGGNIAFQISFCLIPLDLGSPILRSLRTLPRVVRLLDGSKAD